MRKKLGILPTNCSSPYGGLPWNVYDVRNDWFDFHTSHSKIEVLIQTCVDTIFNKNDFFEKNHLLSENATSSGGDCNVEGMHWTTS